MKIALPVKARSLQAEISDTFGRTEYFLIYDMENKTAEYIDNSAAASQGGAGIKAAQTVVDQNVEALLTPQCGENAARSVADTIAKGDYISVEDIQMNGSINKSVIQKFIENNVFEGCMPIETMGQRGYQTMLFGPIDRKSVV